MTAAAGPVPEQPVALERAAGVSGHARMTLTA
jgi:hypothetical protein